MRAFLGRGCALVASLILALFCGAAPAQSYPVRPLRLILPFPAGGPSDIQGRAIADKLSELLGKNVLPDNRPGAGGNLGLEFASRSAPDGYTIVLSSPTIAISPSLYARLNYDEEKDLAPVARLTTIENVLVVHPSVPAKTLKQFIALARSRPGALNFGSGGAGTTNHLANLLLEHLANINMVHVPYKGATQATLALMSGEVDEVVVSVASVTPFIRSGKVRPLAVLSRERVPTLPDVPTAKEAGVDNFNVSIWYGMFAPAATPREIVNFLNQEITKALKSPDLRRKLTSLGINPWPGTPEALGDLVRSERARYAKLIASAGITRR